MNYEEQIMSKDKYPRIFSKSNGGHCVYYTLNNFQNTSNFEDWEQDGAILPLRDYPPCPARKNFPKA